MMLHLLGKMRRLILERMRTDRIPSSSVHTPLCPWTDIQPFARSITTGSPPRSLSPSSPCFDSLPLNSLNAMPDTSRPFESTLTDERTSESPREHGALERIDRHELIALAHLFGYTRVPIFDPDEDAFTVIVSRVADVERPAQIPEWRSGSSTNVTSRELARNLFDDVF